MKRQIEYSDIEITLPTKKKLKINKLIIKMTSSEDIDELQQYIDSKMNRPPSNQQQYFEELSHDQLSENEGADDISNDNMTVISEELISDELENETIMSQDSKINQSIRSIARTSKLEDKYDQIARDLMQMDRYTKGEAMEVKIKDQLESYGFIVTKTQSSIGKRIIGDNGIDLLAQITINNKPTRLIIQSKNWKSELTSQVVRDLQGVLATQYPNWIGLIVINNGGINERAKNQAEGSRNTILIYNFNELKDLKNNLKKMIKEHKIRTQQQRQIEKFENAIITEEINGPIRKTTIEAKKYYRYTEY